MERIITKLINESTEVKTGNNIDEIINENYFNIIKEKLLKFLNTPSVISYNDKNSFFSPRPY